MPNLDFTNLKTLEPLNKNWYELPIPWDPQPRLMVCHAGASNRAYAQAVSNISAKRQRSSGLKAVSDNLAMDRDLFPKFVVTDWEGIRDGDGKLVPFTPEACREFFAKGALPDWIIQRVSSYCAEPSNFIDPEVPSDAEVDQQAGE